MQKIYNILLFIFIFNSASAQICFVDEEDRYCILDVEQRKIILRENPNILSENLLQAAKHWSETYWDSSFWAECLWPLDTTILYTRTWGEKIYMVTPKEIQVTGSESPRSLYAEEIEDSMGNITGAYLFADSIYLSTDSIVLSKSICSSLWKTRPNMEPFRETYSVLGNFIIKHQLDNKLTVSSLLKPGSDIVLRTNFRDKIRRSFSLEALYLLGENKLYRIHPLTRKIDVLLESHSGIRFVDMIYENNRIYLLSTDGTISSLDIRDGEIKSMMYIENRPRSIALDDYIVVADNHSVYCLEKDDLKVSHKINIPFGIKSKIWAIRP